MSSLYYLAALILSAVVIVNADGAARSYDALYHKLTPSEKTETVMQSWLETLTFGLYDGGTRRDARVKSLLESAHSQASKARVAGWVLAAVSAAFLGAGILRARREAAERRVLARHLLGVAGIFLVIGLIAPVISLIAYRDVPVIGTAVVKYESRGILTAITALLHSGNPVVAALLLLFSVVTPAAKLGLSFRAAGTHDGERHRQAVRALRVIGNWSMTDVFVVAVLLALFVVGTDRATDAWPGIGLYFFAGYSILALAAGHLIARAGPVPKPPDGGGGAG